MQADWEFDIAADAPVIDAHWDGLVDLRDDSARAALLPEALQLPGLAEALVLLNGRASPVWTSKSDVWSEEVFDPDELDAPPDAACNLACYLDLLPRDPGAWLSADAVADWCRGLRAALHDRPLRQCRADLVIRAALLLRDQFDFGVTAYVIACGVEPQEAAWRLSAALDVFARAAIAAGISLDALPRESVAAPNASKYNGKIVGE